MVQPEFTLLERPLVDERSEKNLKSNVSLKEEALCFSRGRFTLANYIIGE